MILDRQLVTFGAVLGRRVSVTTRAGRDVVGPLREVALIGGPAGEVAALVVEVLPDQRTLIPWDAVDSITLLPTNLAHPSAR